MNGYLEWTFQAFPTIAYHVNKNESLGMYSFLLIEWTFWLLKLVHGSYMELSLARGLLPYMDGGCFGYKNTFLRVYVEKCSQGMVNAPPNGLLI